MGGLLTSGVLTDVVLVPSDGRELSAHRAILAAHSQVLQSLKKEIERNLKNPIEVHAYL
jgi:hypothetical protein